MESLDPKSLIYEFTNNRHLDRMFRELKEANNYMFYETADFLILHHPSLTKQYKAITDSWDMPFHF